VRWQPLRGERSFKNSALGEPWVETDEAPDWQRLYERREAWQIGTVPSGALFLTVGADVQKDRIEIDVRWGRGHESWLFDHIVIEGGPEHAESSRFALQLRQIPRMAFEPHTEATNISGVLRRQPLRRSRRVFRSSYIGSTAGPVNSGMS
jgi:Terminase large subunit gpA, endonuclease domain